MHPTCLAAIASMIVATAKQAQTYIVAPNIYTNTEGPGSNSSFLRTQNFPWDGQVIYNAN